MQLFCVRHGQAEDMPNANGERPLTTQGKKDIKRLTRYLHQQGIIVPQIQHSGKCRALETATLLATALLPNQTPSICPLLLPSSDNASLPALLRLIHQETKTLMLVSHMPLIAQLVSLLITHSDQYPIVHFLPGTIACLERYHADQWTINWIISPHVIPQ